MLKELIDLREEQNGAFMAELLKPGRMLAVFDERLRAAGIDQKSFASHERLDKLRLVANVVKHGAGSSSEQLRKRNRMLFVDPVLRA